MLPCFLAARRVYAQDKVGPYDAMTFLTCNACTLQSHAQPCFVVVAVDVGSCCLVHSVPVPAQQQGLEPRTPLGLETLAVIQREFSGSYTTTTAVLLYHLSYRVVYQVCRYIRTAVAPYRPLVLVLRVRVLYQVPGTRRRYLLQH